MDRNLYYQDNMRTPLRVALRKESVDRNSTEAASLTVSTTVALRKESVDRNKYVVQCRKALGGRSPQGERG